MLHNSIERENPAQRSNINILITANTFIAPGTENRLNSIKL